MADTLDTLLSFIPIDRRLALAQGQSLPDRATGTVLFADVSGFTPLTEALAQALGPQRGAEEITRHLDMVYGTLIGRVEEYGGSVVSFSGDAITCWFDQDAGLRAVAAGLAMQAAMQALPAIPLNEGASVQPALKVAVAHGSVRRFVVGDPQVHRLDVLAGGLLDTLGAIHGLAEKGEVVVDERSAPQLADGIIAGASRRGRESGPGIIVVNGLRGPVEPQPWPALPPATLAESDVRPWLLPAVYERLRHGAGEFLADVRPAAALFVSFTGIDYDDDDAGLLLDAYVRSVQATLARYEALLLNLTIGDKGSYLHGVAGAPQAHDDDAARAVAIALELRMPPAHLNYISQVRIGLAQGQMYSGAYGCPDRRTFGVQGDKTNLAARLMELARPNEILCDDDTYRQARRQWAFDSLPPARVKGKAGLIRVYRPTGQPAAPAGREGDQAGEPRLVGRAPEVARLLSALDALQAGQGGVAIVEGEAGIGKSRLVEELVRAARLRGLTGLIGAGQSVEQQTAYRAWRDILASFFDLEAIGDPTARRARVQQAAHEFIPKLTARLPLLNDILPLGLPETPLTAALDAALRQESLTGLVVSLLRMWARERPLILVLEDAHWLDSLSWQLTLHVARALLLDRSPLLLVLVSRGLDEQSQGAPVVAALRGLAGTVTDIALGALTPDETVALAAQRLGLPPGGLPEPAAALVRERAGGNPFFAEELAYALRERGLIRIAPAPDRAGEPGAALECVISGDLASAQALLPDTLQGLILSRIDRLPADQQFVIKVAAVIGRSFGYPPVRDMLGQFGSVPEEAARRNLDALIRHDLTLVEASEPELSYAFKHIVIHEVAYGTLLFAQRQQIHLAVAEWYLARLPAEPAANGGPDAAVLPLLVHHFRQAEAPQREQHFARLAGEQAARKHANTEAIQYLSRALELTPAASAQERFELLLARETVYELQGARDPQASDLEQLQELSLALGTSAQAVVGLRQSTFAYQTGDYPAAVLAAEHAAAQAAAASQAETEARACLQWGMALWQQANFVEAQARNEQALGVARRERLRVIEAECLRQQGIIFDAQGEYGAARAALEESLQLHHAASDQRGESKCLNSLGVVAYNQEDYAAATAYYEHSLELKDEMGDRYGRGITLQNLGIVAIDQGDLAQAQGFFQQALAVCREIDDREGEASALDGLGMIALRLGNYPAAQPLIEQSIAISRQIGDRLNVSAGLTSLSEVRLAQADAAAALTHSLEALHIAQDIGTRYYEAAAWQQVGQTHLGLGRAAEAAEAFQNALGIYESLGKPRFSIEPLTGLARTARLQGALDQALAHVNTILVLAAGATRTPVLTYLICYEVLNAAGDPRAAELLKQAHSLLQSQANMIADEATRRRFLNDIAWNRDLQLAWQQAGSR